MHNLIEELKVLFDCRFTVFRGTFVIVEALLPSSGACTVAVLPIFVTSLLVVLATIANNGHTSFTTFKHN